MDEFLPFASKAYWATLALVCFARAMDFLSTYVATPNLVLEGNPIAKWLGWKGGIALNIGLAFLFAFWPLPAVVITTTSLLVAARNLQSAWIMRSMGEDNYRSWMIQRMSAANIPTVVLCIVGQAVFFALIGAALMSDARRILSLGIGMGMLTYAFASLLYSLLSVFRLRRRSN